MNLNKILKDNTKENRLEIYLDKINYDYITYEDIEQIKEYISSNY